MTTSNRPSSAKPFLRWAGSKQQLVPVLSRYWDSTYNRYIEPFVGSGALFFNISPSFAILGDINKELILTYRQVKNNLEEVIDALKGLRVNQKNYLHQRSIQPSTLTPAKRAARFIFLNRFSFNGIYRTNNSGQFNVPYNGGEGKIPSAELLGQCSRALRTTSFRTSSFENTLEEVKSGDFVYIDPPYRTNGKRTFNEYDASLFSQDQLHLLREWMLRLYQKNIPFLVSYAESEEGSYLSKGFYSEIVSVRRNIAGFAANRRHANELLISNIRPKAEED